MSLVLINATRAFGVELVGVEKRNSNHLIVELTLVGFTFLSDLRCKPLVNHNRLIKSKANNPVSTTKPVDNYKQNL